MSLTPGTRIGPYEVTGSLGAGGMGEVYRASDTRLDRDVALKVLPDAFAADPDRLARFEREAKILASLNHPNIGGIHGLVESDPSTRSAGSGSTSSGQVASRALVLELVEGPTLADRIASGPLSLNEALAIAKQIAAALEAAHDAGVIHRDLKPANVKVRRDGTVKVLDFGLARAQSTGDAGDETLETNLTQAGAVLGTVAYMSPEQARGESVDQRTDLFALGTVLYEMVTGQPAFAGETTGAIFEQLFTKPIAPATRLRPDLPEALDRLLNELLARDPDRRCQSARQLSDGIDRIIRDTTSRTPPPSASVGRDLPSIVVLPFVNRSPDQDNEYFSDGLTDEIISDLSGVAALRVISRNSAMTLKGTSKDTPTLARELGVSHLVSGTVRKAGDALRVTAELVEARTDAPIWSEKFSGTMEDVFGIQEEIARRIVSALKVRLTPSESKVVAEHPIEDPVAYDCYLRAYQTMYHWTPLAQTRAFRLVDEALRIVGDSALLLAMKGQLHWNRANLNLGPPDEALDAAAALVDRALAVDPESYLAIFVRGLVAGGRGQTGEALRDLYDAHARRPGDTNVLVEMCRYSNSAGLRRHWTHIDAATQIDPLSPTSHVLVADYFTFNGPAVKVADATRRAIALAPETSMLHTFAGWELFEAGQPEEGMHVMEQALRLHTDGVGRATARFLLCAAQGDQAAALEASTPAMEAALGNEASSRLIAGACARVGLVPKALAWLRAAVDRGFIHYPNLSTNVTLLEALGDEPVYRSLLAEVEPRWKAVVEWERSLD